MALHRSLARFALARPFDVPRAGDLPPCVLCDGPANAPEPCTQVYSLCEECNIGFFWGTRFCGVPSWSDCDHECLQEFEQTGKCRHGIPEDYTCLTYVGEVMIDWPRDCSDEVADAIRRNLKKDRFRFGGRCKCFACIAAREVSR